MPQAFSSRFSVSSVSSASPLSRLFFTRKAVAALGCVLALAGTPALAAGTQNIVASGAWVRWLPSNLPAAGYVTLANHGDKPVDLTSVSSADYGSAMLHESVSNGSTQKMVMVDKITVPAHGQVRIAPGGYHLMLEQARHKIAPGDTVHLQLKFSDGEALDTAFAVKSPAQGGEMGGASGNDSGSMKGMSGMK